MFCVLGLFSFSFFLVLGRRIVCFFFGFGESWRLEGRDCLVINWIWRGWREVVRDRSVGLARGEFSFGFNEVGFFLWIFNGGEDGVCGMGVFVLVEDSVRTFIWFLFMEVVGVGIGVLKIGFEDVI